MNTPTISQLSRREFLKLSGLGLLGALLPPPNLLRANQPAPFGRVMDDVILVYDRPSFAEGQAVRTYYKDSILPISDTVVGDAYPAHNQAWFEIRKIGYIHTALLQPVELRLNEPEKRLSFWGELAEITVPFTDARLEPSRDGDMVYRYYYSTTHWVNKLVYDERNQPWYQVIDDREDGQNYYVQAAHVRIIPKEELGQISPQVPVHHKRLEVRMIEQMVIAYEAAKPVFITQASTGDQATNPRWETPLGQFDTFYKRPSRHMAAGNLAFGDYDLPGVPWVCYITEYGIAFHGTYWHNDFGQPRSHGCINLTPEAAKWIYRWTMPVVPHDYHLKWHEGHGTRVDIVVSNQS